MFEKATRLKLRLSTTVGTLTVEDLWDLSLTHLDKLAISLRNQVKEDSQESFIKPKGSADTILNLQFDIVKHVIETKLIEIEERENTELKKSEKDKLLRILAGKEDDELEGLSKAALKKRIAAL